MKRISLILLARHCARRRPARAQLTEEALLDTLQHSAFEFFWNEANPTNGLIRDRSQSGSPCSIASQGFGLSAICVGDRPRLDHARRRAPSACASALQTFWTAPQGPDAGDGVRSATRGSSTTSSTCNTGLRVRGISELSTIDTALLFAGISTRASTSPGSTPPRPRSARWPTRSPAAPTGS